MSTDKTWTDEDWANLSDEDLFELDIPNEGEGVYNLYWDSGGPFAGANNEWIYKFRGAYFRDTTQSSLEGPFKSLDEALEDTFLQLGPAVESIWCSELSAEELTWRLYLDYIDVGYKVKINDDTYEFKEEEFGRELVKLKRGE